MSDSRIVEQMKKRQQDVFRVALDPLRFNLTLKRIASLSGLGYDSVRDYASGKTVMPITALDALIDVVPDELLSNLLGKGRCVVRVPEEVDHDELERAFLDYAATKAAAHHPESPAGRDIAECERATLDAKVVHLPIVGRAA